MLKEMNEHILNINADSECRMVILNSSSPKVFCAGANLKERASMNKY